MKENKERKDIVLGLAVFLGLVLFLVIALALAPSKARAAEDQERTYVLQAQASETT